MRQFENENFPYRLAEGIESHSLSAPDEEAERALSYIRQFVYHTASESELHRGYITEEMVDALIRIRDTNSNRGFNSAVEQIGAPGETSTEVTEYDELTFIEVENSVDAERGVSTIAREHSQELSEDARKVLYSIKELLLDNRQDVLYYLPQEIAHEIIPHLDERGILL